MRKPSAIWQSVILLALGLAVTIWAGAHGRKDWPVPEEAKKRKNPVPATEASLAAGKALFLDQCAQCHGEQGKGDGPDAPLYSVKAADFTDAHMMEGMTDGEIFWKLSKGRRPMPSFKERLTEEQRWQLVNFLRTLASKPAPAPKPQAAPSNKKAAPGRQPKGEERNSQRESQNSKFGTRNAEGGT